MRRTVGVLAVVLGAVGVVLGIVLVVASLRVMVGVHDRVDGALAGLTTTVETVEARVDTGDSSAALAVLENVDAALEALDANPLISLLPVDADPLADQLGRLQTTIADEPVRTRVVAELDEATDRLEDLRDRLRTWLRIGSAAVVMLATWAVWAQVELVRSGIRRLRRQQDDG